MKPLPWVHTALVAAGVFLLPMSETVSAQDVPAIVISELRFRGITNTDEFIELFNPTSVPVNIGGWTIVGSDSLGVTTVRTTVPADSMLNPGCYYLVTHATGYQGVVPGDSTYTASFADSGDVAVLDATGAISDQVGFNPGNLYQEPPTLAPLSINGNNSYERKPGGEDGHADTNNNAEDFRLRLATADPPEPANPQNSQSPCISVVTPDVDAPVFDQTPEDIEAEATSADGAVVNYESPTATDNVDPTVEVSCQPQSGSVFRLGNTSVLCSAEDAAGNTAGVWFTVTVQDTTAPSLTVPGDITAEAESPAGKVVTFQVTASDAVTAVPMTVCTPASGSTFTLGTTTVNCQASDDAGNSSAAAFTVTIIAPALGRIHGGGELLSGDLRITFSFEAREAANYVERGWLMLHVRHGDGRPDTLMAANVFDVRFTNPGRVMLSGYGNWNGEAGYRFDIAASDLGETGVGEDTIELVVRAPNGEAVLTASGVISAGNIQSR